MSSADGGMPDPTVLVCTGCGRGIDRCELCERAECGTALCYRCVNLALRQAVPEPHAHGG
ncbi:MAG TPA: hypothetical protein VF129_11460 [Actinomycetota bacterium]